MWETCLFDRPYLCLGPDAWGTHLPPVLGRKPRASYMLGKYFTTELPPSKGDIDLGRKCGPLLSPPCQVSRPLLADHQKRL